jgi:hypothetical protein
MTDTPGKLELAMFDDLWPSRVLHLTGVSFAGRVGDDGWADFADFREQGAAPDDRVGSLDYRLTPGLED